MFAGRYVHGLSAREEQDELRVVVVLRPSGSDDGNRNRGIYVFQR